MLLLTVFCGIPAYPASCFPDLPGFKVFSASLVAFVPSCGLFAVRTCPLNIPVGKESLIIRAVRKPYNLWIYVPPVDQSFHNAVCPCMVREGIGVAKNTEFNLHRFKNTFKMLM